MTAESDRIEILKEMYPLIIKPGDLWGDLSKIEVELLVVLNAFAQYVSGKFGKQVRVNSGYREGNSGYHPKGQAVDIAAVGVSCVNLYLAAERFDGFNGIGVYPDWHTPGIHVDVRPKHKKLEPDARWGCLRRNGKQAYTALDDKFLEYAIKNNRRLS